MYLLLLRVVLVTRLLPANAKNHRPPNVAHQKDVGMLPGILCHGLKFPRASLFSLQYYLSALFFIHCLSFVILCFLGIILKHVKRNVTFSGVLSEQPLTPESSLNFFNIFIERSAMLWYVSECTGPSTVSVFQLESFRSVVCLFFDSL